MPEQKFHEPQEPRKSRNTVADIDITKRMDYMMLQAAMNEPYYQFNNEAAELIDIRTKRYRTNNKHFAVLADAFSGS